MPPYEMFPAINAVLNGTSGVLILVGREFIRRGQVGRHRFCMVAAVITSSLFLACYVWYHAHVGVVRFRGTGWTRPLYFSILISHTVLAMVVAPMVGVTLWHAVHEAFGKHRRIARWTYPIWVYVSITGVLVYVMLYHLFP